MDKSTKILTTSLVTLGVTIPVIYVLYKKWKRQNLKRNIENIQSYKASSSKTTFGITDDNEIIDLAKNYQIISVDCEWVHPSPSGLHISLLQLSFPNGRCFLLQNYTTLPGTFFENSYLKYVINAFIDYLFKFTLKMVCQKNFKTFKSI